MSMVRILVIASLGIVPASQPLFAQSLSRYRTYTLESSLAAVIKTSGARAVDLKTLHERPAKIQKLEWRAPYLTNGNTAADPVHSMLFSFYDDQLYRIVVMYERDRMEGLTNADVTESISSAYGALPMQTRASDSPPLDMPPDTTLVARWDDGASVLSLVRAGYTHEFQLVLLSKQLSARARTAVQEAERLDTREAPQREIDQRKRELDSGRVAQEKARAANKVAFKP